MYTLLFFIIIIIVIITTIIIIIAMDQFCDIHNNNPVVRKSSISLRISLAGDWFVVKNRKLSLVTKKIFFIYRTSTQKHCQILWRYYALNFSCETFYSKNRNYQIMKNMRIKMWRVKNQARLKPMIDDMNLFRLFIL